MSLPALNLRYATKHPNYMGTAMTVHQHLGLLSIGGGAV
jgi:hypothetical protein